MPPRKKKKFKQIPRKYIFNAKEAVMCGSLPELKRHIEAGAPVDGEGEEFTPLMFAVGEGSLKIASYLIERGANINHRNDIGQTVLMVAVTTGSRQMIELLLKSGADPVAHDYSKRNAIAWAASRGDFPELVAMLARAGADVNAPDIAGITPLMRASLMGYPKTVATMLAMGADPGKKADPGTKFGGKTAYQLALDQCNLAVCELLEVHR